jgi:rsbT co-antagonist protein RsbR
MEDPTDPAARIAALDAKATILEELLLVHERTAASEARRREAAVLELEEKNRSLVASEREKNEALQRLRHAVQELSTPILEIWDDVLALPIIGVIDARRSSEMMERLLEEVARKRSRFVIIDITGVELVDTSTADHFIKLVRAVELLGARCMITGVSPAVAQTLVSLGVDLGALTTLQSLRHALKECLRLSGGRG